MSFATRKIKQGIVSSYSLRTARTGNLAHEFNIGSRRYSLFSENDTLVHFQDGDLIKFEYTEARLKSGSRREYLRVLPETVELLIPEANERLAGYIYILSNGAMKDVVKIGFTTGTPEARAAELSASTGVPRKFKVEWSQAVQCDPKAVEQRVHAKLKPKNAGKEFFRVSVDEAKDAILDAYYVVAPVERDALDASMQQRNKDFLARQAAHLEAQVRMKDAKAVEAFWRSPVGEWLERGSCKSTLSTFRTPVQDAPNAISGLFGKKVAPWIRVKIVGRGNHPGHTWRVFLEGVAKNKKVDTLKDVASLQSVKEIVADILRQDSFQNIEVTIDINNRLLASPNCHDYRISRGHETVPTNLNDISLIDTDDQEQLMKIAAMLE